MSSHTLYAGLFIINAFNFDLKEFKDLVNLMLLGRLFHMLWPLNSREVLPVFLEQYKACKFRGFLAD